LLLVEMQKTKAPLLGEMNRRAIVELDHVNFCCEHNSQAVLSSLLIFRYSIVNL